MIDKAIDAREASFLSYFPTAVADLRAGGAEVEVLFLECSNLVLEKRYRETRRVHPLSPGGTVEEGIEREREVLADAARLSDVVIDTSAGLSEATLSAIDLSTDLVLLCDLSASALRGLRKVVDALDILGIATPTRHFVVNRADSKVGISNATPVKRQLTH